MDSLGSASEPVGDDRHEDDEVNHAESDSVTDANVDDLVSEFGYKPSMPVKKGVHNFVKWYKSHYKV